MYNCNLLGKKFTNKNGMLHIFMTLLNDFYLNFCTLQFDFSPKYVRRVANGMQTYIHGICIHRVYKPILWSHLYTLNFIFI